MKTAKIYKDNQDFFDNSTNEEKMRIISNNVDERQIIPTKRWQFICSSVEDWMKEQWPWYIFRAKIENNKKQIKWYQIWVSTKFEDLIKIAYLKLVNCWYLEKNIFLPPPPQDTKD